MVRDDFDGIAGGTYPYWQCNCGYLLQINRRPHQRWKSWPATMTHECTQQECINAGDDNKRLDTPNVKDKVWTILPHTAQLNASQTRALESWGPVCARRRCANPSFLFWIINRCSLGHVTRPAWWELHTLSFNQLLVQLIASGQNVYASYIVKQIQ